MRAGRRKARCDPMSARRAAAIGALLFGFAGLALAAVIAVQEFPRGLIALGCVTIAAAAAWLGIVRRGAGRVAGLAIAAVGLAVAIGLVVGERVLEELLVAALLAVACVLGRAAFAIRTELPPALRPLRPVLFFNPKSGGGKAEKFALAAQARSRGIEPIELGPPWDLERLVRDAVAGGADALGMAGGDGSQAIVAAVAAEHGLPYACIPAGTRNHFALDLGVDRDDVVGALEAFVDGGGRVVDLAEVNGRVFVNNVSLGLYAESVQREGYRDAKIRTILDTVPDVLGPNGKSLDLHWTGPDGAAHDSAATILVSNNRYRLGKLIGSGTRPRMDEHLLGVAAVGSGGPRLLEWTTPAFEVTSGVAVPAGIDGEAVELDSPVRFAMRPSALRVRIAPAHPGASPSAAEPGGGWGPLRKLVALAAGRD